MSNTARLSFGALMLFAAAGACVVVLHILFSTLSISFVVHLDKEPFEIGKLNNWARTISASVVLIYCAVISRQEKAKNLFKSGLIVAGCLMAGGLSLGALVPYVGKLFLAVLSMTAFHLGVALQVVTFFAWAFYLSSGADGRSQIFLANAAFVSVISAFWTLLIASWIDPLSLIEIDTVLWLCVLFVGIPVSIVAVKFGDPPSVKSEGISLWLDIKNLVVGRSLWALMLLYAYAGGLIFLLAATVLGRSDHMSFAIDLPHLQLNLKQASIFYSALGTVLLLPALYRLVLRFGKRTALNVCVGLLLIGAVLIYPASDWPVAYQILFTIMVGGGVGAIAALVLTTVADFCAYDGQIRGSPRPMLIVALLYFASVALGSAMMSLMSAVSNLGHMLLAVVVTFILIGLVPTKKFARQQAVGPAESVPNS